MERSRVGDGVCTRSIILSVQADAKNYKLSYQSPGGELVTIGIGIGECFFINGSSWWIYRGVLETVSYWKWEGF